MDKNTPIHWEVIDEQLHAPCKIFDVYKRHCRHPGNGKEGDFYVIKSPDWALAVGITENNELIMVNQYRFSTEKLSLEVPGGIIDQGETATEAAVRELQEETGYTGHNARLIGSCHPNPAILNNTAHFVLIENCTKSHDTNWDHHEELQMHTYPLDKVDELIKDGTITHAITLNALLFLKTYLE